MATLLLYYYVTVWLYQCVFFQAARTTLSLPDDGRSVNLRCVWETCQKLLDSNVLHQCLGKKVGALNISLEQKLTSLG